MVVLGRQQLFTESTITAVLPVMVGFSRTTRATNSGASCWQPTFSALLWWRCFLLSLPC
jgi:formate/nitrite transporter FocA (FNT family)